MKEIKSSENINVTVITEEDEKKTRAAAQSATEFETQRVTVVDETLFERWRARIFRVMRSPLLFLLSLGLSVGIGYGLAYWQLNSRASARQTSVSPPSLDYAALSNGSLREESLDTSNEIRKFLLAAGVKQQQLSEAVVAQMSSLTSENGRQQAWSRYTASADVLLAMAKISYERDFRERVQKLRRELLSRAGAKAKPNAELDYLYEHAATPAEIRQVMDDLANLAEALLTP